MYSPFIRYVLHLADNALIMGHRCSEWCGHGPVLEQDIALANLALDYVGTARNFYQYAAELINTADPAQQVTEDSLAYLRDANDFYNNHLAELPNGDWAQTTLKEFFFSVYQQGMYRQLLHSSDAQIAAVAEKALKEIDYHVRWSSEWVVRLGDGTAESKERLLQALEEIWVHTGELFASDDHDASLLQENLAADLQLVYTYWRTTVEKVFEEATIAVPPPAKTAAWMGNGRKGIHTEHLGYILAEMQYLQRAYPGCEW